MSKSGFQELGNLSERIPGLINIARIAIVLPLLVMHAFGVYSNGTHIGMSFLPVEFYSWAALYSFLILLSVARPDWQWQTLDLPNASAVVDISMMMILVYIACGLEFGSQSFRYENCKGLLLLYNFAASWCKSTKN